MVDLYGLYIAVVFLWQFIIRPRVVPLSRGTSSRGGERYSIYPWVGRCGPAPHTLTVFKTNIADFPILIKTDFRFLIPCLRYQSMEI